MIIGIAGTLGAGKGTVVEYLKTKGFVHYSASGYLRQVIESEGEVPNRESYSALATKIRNADEAGLSKILYHQAEKNGDKKVIIEALHDVGEAQYILEVGGLLLGVDVDPKIRYARQQVRGSEKDAVTFDEFLVQIAREEEGGGKHNIREAINLADHTIMNDGTIEELHSKVETWLQTLI
jgi:dephospho-CoA kinase